MTARACITSLNDGPACGAPASYEVKGMCVHEHLHRAAICRIHAATVRALAAEHELTCATCQRAGAPAVEVIVQLLPLERAS